MAAKGTKTPGANGAAADAPESLDQVRDILFGGQMRMVDARLQGLEARLQQEQSSMRAEIGRELADLDGTLKKGLAQVNDRLAGERTKRAEDLKALSADMKESLKALEKRHQALEEAASLADAELRDHLVKQSAMLAADIAKTSDRLTSQLDRVATKLQAEKLDTAALASGLTELAGRLTGTGKRQAK